MGCSFYAVAHFCFCSNIDGPVQSQKSQLDLIPAEKPESIDIETLEIPDQVRND